jgi:hypothetical protein
MDVYNKLLPLSIPLINKVVNRYENDSQMALIFNKECLTTISHELISEIKLKVENNLVDDKGIYNYFKKAFSFKCQDLYRKHSRLKRKVLLLNKDINDVEFGVKDNSVSLTKNPEFVELINDINEKLISFSDSSNQPLTKIFNLIYEGYTIKEISEKIDTSLSSTKRMKNKIIYFLNTEYNNNEDFKTFFEPLSDVTRFSIKSPVKSEENLYLIETSYGVKSEFAHIKLYQQIDGKKLIIDEEFCTTQHQYDKKYIDLKKKLIILN